jgi:lipid-A-disaccharide synthase
MLDAAARLVAQSPVKVRVAVSDAGHLSETLGAGRAGALARALRPIVWTGEVGDLLRAADLAVVASGTATLETAALGVPMVIVYRTGWLNYQIARRLVRVPHIGLANLISGRAGAPELIQDRANGPEIAGALARLLTDAAVREAQASAFAQLPAILGGEGSDMRAADALIAFAAGPGRG